MTQPLQFGSSLNTKFDLPAPPDLLRRFVSLPYDGTLRIAGVGFRVQTNDNQLLQTLVSENTETGETSVLLKLVVDPDLNPGHDTGEIIIDSGALCWASVRGLLLVFDRESGHICIFVPVEQVPTFGSVFEDLLCRIEPILAEAGLMTRSADSHSKKRDEKTSDTFRSFAHRTHWPVKFERES